MLESLKEAVWHANLELVRAGLVTLTWGNVSGLDRAAGLFGIKPSGVPYDELKPEHIVLVDLEGQVAEGRLKPSSDTPTHRLLYRAFAGIGGITHTHSTQATAFAQAARAIPCLGTTHADHFHGAVPVTRELTAAEIAGDYEAETGRVIIERLAGTRPEEMPAVLVARHGPFTWGRDALASVHNAIALETVARMAALTWALNPATGPAPAELIEKHYQRKHGPHARYGQG